MSERARAEVWPSRLANAYLLAVALFAVAVAVHAAREHLTDLFVDDWRVLDHYQSLSLPAFLTTPENGHHIPLTLALFALDHELFGDKHRQRGISALPHIDVRHHEGDHSGAIDAQEGVRREPRTGLT